MDPDAAGDFRLVDALFEQPSPLQASLLQASKTFYVSFESACISHADNSNTMARKCHYIM